MISFPNRVLIPNSLFLLSNVSYCMLNLRNRRFLYNPYTFELVLGDSGVLLSDGVSGSHAEEHYDSNAKGKFDDFMRGWIAGSCKDYPHGIIHFAPSVSYEDFSSCPDFADRVLLTIDHFINNGACRDTIVRNLLGPGETTLYSLFPDMF